jgi:hypothetical protein
VHRLGKVGYGTGIEDSGCGQLPSRFRTVPDLARMNHHEGQGGRSQCRDYGPVIAARGCEHHERGLGSLELGDEGRHPRVIVRHGPAGARGPQGDITLRFGNIDTNKDLRGRHDHSSLARPCRMRARWHRTPVRALAERPRRPMLRSGLGGPRLDRPIASAYGVLGILARPSVKIQGWKASLARP